MEGGDWGSQPPASRTLLSRLPYICLPLPIVLRIFKLWSNQRQRVYNFIGGNVLFSFPTGGSTIVSHKLKSYKANNNFVGVLLLIICNVKRFEFPQTLPPLSILRGPTLPPFTKFQTKENLHSSFSTLGNHTCVNLVCLVFQTGSSSKVLTRQYGPWASVSPWITWVCIDINH